MDMTEDLRQKAWEQISEEHSVVCVCGRLCTGLHERNCSKFQKAVDVRMRKLEKLNGKSTHA